MEYADLIKAHSGELLFLGITALVLLTLLIALPQLLRANLRKNEMQHIERLKSIEKGLPLPVEDDRARMMARTAMLVPMVVMIAAGTVTSFLAVYKSENLFAVSLGIWVVAGAVSLAAITGGVALIGRLAQIQAGEKDEEEDEERQSSYMN